MATGRGSSEAKVGQDASDALAFDRVSLAALSLAIARIGEDDFDRQLLAWLRGLVAFDSSIVLLYAPDQRPQILLDALDNPGRRNSALSYVEGAYLLDPFYRQAGGSQEPRLLQLADIMPDDFSRSDYYESYYRRSAVRDEVNFLIPVEGATCAVALERSLRGEPFSADDLRKLRILLPLVDALVRRHRSIRSDREEPGEPDREHLRLERILADFGRDVLTAREREVAGLMLRGHALAQIAGRLRISSETARVHRRNIYEKLEISSLAELFSLALADLASRR